MLRPNELKVFIVAGEASGDQLASALIPELRRRADGNISFAGVGGELMEAEGFHSLFPLSDVSVMGPLAIASRLPKIVRRVYETVDAVVAFKPDVLVIVDSPEFTHPIAKRVRKRMPDVPVVNYVSPSIWAWRPGRAARMKPYVDHVLALLPFEPAAHERLGGPDCTYVGHPLIERLEWMNSLDASALARNLELKEGVPVLTVLPGSRSNEVRRLMGPFGAAIRLLQERIGPVEVLIPVVPSVRDLVEKGARNWPVKPHLVSGRAEKFQAFRLCDAALAASGTVTLELALAGTPMVVGYKVDLWFAAILQYFISAPSAVLPNLIIEDKTFPEFLQWHCTPKNLVDALEPLMSDTVERRAQLDGIARLRERIKVNESTPSGKAAEVVLDVIRSSART